MRSHDLGFSIRFLTPHASLRSGHETDLKLEGTVEAPFNKKRAQNDAHALRSESPFQDYIKACSGGGGGGGEGGEGSGGEAVGPTAALEGKKAIWWSISILAHAVLTLKISI